MNQSISLMAYIALIMNLTGSCPTPMALRSTLSETTAGVIINLPSINASSNVIGMYVDQNPRGFLRDEAQRYHQALLRMAKPTGRRFVI